MRVMKLARSCTGGQQANPNWLSLIAVRALVSVAVPDFDTLTDTTLLGV